LDELIRTLEHLPETRIEPQPHHWSIQLTKPDGIHLEIVVPRDVLEWFVTARDLNGSELWSDWMDYQGYVPKSEERPEQLAAQMRNHVEVFVRTLAGAEGFRVTEHRTLGVVTRRRAEWHFGGEWQPVVLARD
jgi:hypothetical protein